jgi:putative membrane protein
LRPGRDRPRPVHFLHGLMMGAADIVPGVSGGTVALIVGIYERLIASVRAAATAAAKLLRLRPAESRGALHEVEWPFVIPLGLGVLTALVIGARLIEPLLHQYPVQLRALFFGLIAASLAIPWRRREAHRSHHYALALAAAAAAFLLVGIPPREVADPALPIVFLAASIAICAMILPGVSGSFLLLVMGMYQPTLAALNSLHAAYIAVFVAGAAVGLGVFSKLLHYLLRAHHDVTMAALVGLMAGSLRALWPYQDESRALLAPPSTGSLLVVAAIALLGFAAVAALAKIGSLASRPHDRLRPPAARR